MFLSTKLSLSNLVFLCRVLRHSLDAGLTLPRVFRQQAEKGPKPVRTVAARITQLLERGENLEAALQREKEVFPALFLDLACVGERSGCLPEMFKSLESYYRTQEKLWRQFLSRIMLPVMQFVFAVFVIAGLIFVLGMIAEGRNHQPIDPLGVGLTGATGAILFLAIVFGGVCALVGAYLFARRMKQRASVDAFLLRLPVIGPCLYSLAMTRFCMAMRLTLETSMPIGEALRLCLRATGNESFAAASNLVERRLEQGIELTRVLTETGVFQEEFLQIVAVAEETGQLPEVMQRQAKQFEEESERRMTVLTRLAGFLIWLGVSALIVVAIFRIALKAYIEPLNQF